MPWEQQEGSLLGSFLGFVLGGIIGANWRKLREAANSFMQSLKKGKQHSVKLILNTYVTPECFNRGSNLELILLRIPACAGMTT